VSRGPQTFKQRDVSAAIRAAKTAGLEVARVEVDRAGKIVIVTTKGAIEPVPGNEWDEVFDTQEKDKD
jgi:hypothetical protein